MVKDLFDLPVPLHSLRIINSVPTGIVGLSGSVASAIGLWQVRVGRCLLLIGLHPWL